jgi:hypothetical protein
MRAAVAKLFTLLPGLAAAISATGMECDRAAANFCTNKADLADDWTSAFARISP